MIGRAPAGCTAATLSPASAAIAVRLISGARLRLCSAGLLPCGGGLLQWREHISWVNQSKGYIEVLL